MMNDKTALFLRILKDSAGNYLWRSTDDALFGKRVLISDYMPDADSGNNPILFGDFSYYWIIGRYPLSVRAIIERFTITGQVGYLAFEFLDAKLTRREAIKALAVSSGEAKYMKDTPSTEKEIDGTTYIVESAVGIDAKETVYEKLKRLILHDSDRHNLLRKRYQ